MLCVCVCVCVCVSATPAGCVYLQSGGRKPHITDFSLLTTDHHAECVSVCSVCLCVRAYAVCLSVRACVRLLCCVLIVEQHLVSGHVCDTDKRNQLESPLQFGYNEQLIKSTVASQQINAQSVCVCVRVCVCVCVRVCVVCVWRGPGVCV